jgi:hypothetical protein
LVADKKAARGGSSLGIPRAGFDLGAWLDCRFQVQAVQVIDGPFLLDFTFFFWYNLVANRLPRLVLVASLVCVDYSRIRYSWLACVFVLGFGKGGGVLFFFHETTIVQRVLGSDSAGILLGLC